MACVGLYATYRSVALLSDLRHYRHGTYMAERFHENYKTRFARAVRLEVADQEKGNADMKALLSSEEAEPAVAAETDEFTELLEALEDDPYEIDPGDPYENYTLLQPSAPPDSVTWGVTKGFDGIYIAQITARWRGILATNASRSNIAIFGEPQLDYINAQVIETFSSSADENFSLDDENLGWRLIHTTFSIF